MILKYETLASQPEKTLRKVCNFLDEPYAPEMLTMAGAPGHAKHGNSSFGEIEPGTISTRSIGRFRNILDPKDIQFIQTFSGKLMIGADYQPEPFTYSGDHKARFWLVHVPFNGASMLKSRIEEAMTIRRGEAIPDNRMITYPRHLETSPGILW